MSMTAGMFRWQKPPLANHRLYFDYVGGTLNAMEQGGKKTVLLYGVNRVGEVSADGIRHFTLLPIKAAVC